MIILKDATLNHFSKYFVCLDEFIFINLLTYIFYYFLINSYFLLLYKAAVAYWKYDALNEKSLDEYK